MKEVLMVIAVTVVSSREVSALCSAVVVLLLAAVVTLREVAAVCSAVVVLVLAAVVILREVVLAVARSSREVPLAVSSREVLAACVPAGMGMGVQRV